MRLSQRTKVVMFLFIVLLLIYIYIFFGRDGSNEMQNRGFQFFPMVSSDSSGKCILKSYDVWGIDIMKHVNHEDSQRKCTTSFVKITDLESGLLKVKSEGYYCEGRCIFQQDNYASNFSEWQRGQNYTYECDFVEARCARKGILGLMGSYFSYGMIHSQIFEQRENKSEVFQKPKHAYNLFVILIDSTGMSQAYRNLPRTMSYMEKTLESVTFPHLNKVGRNSRPNCFALWFGIQLETIDRSVYGLPNVPKDRDWDETCNNFLDNETNIFDEFSSQGYKTMMGDDLPLSVDVYPNCKGLLRKYLDHRFQPFPRAVENNMILNTTYKGSNCQFVYKDMLKYQEQFINSYKEYPKFSWIWTSTVSHDFESSSMTMDNDFLDFLVRNHDILDESFLVIQGDHGLRFGNVTQTKLGTRDNNNPLFTISLPKSLRNSPVRDQLVENANNLQTQYDVRATYLDIAKYQPNSGFTDISNLKISNEKGQSLFRKQIGERSCRTLPIPVPYCICETEMRKLDSNNSTFDYLGEAVIEHINSILVAKNVTDICNLWTFANITSIEAYLPEDKNIYLLVVSPSYPYDKAQFKATVRVDGNEKYSVANIERLDVYGRRGICITGNGADDTCDCIKQE